MSLPTVINEMSMMEDIGELSFYEDALDESDEEMMQLHQDTSVQLSKSRTRSRQQQITSIINNAPSSSRLQPPHSSSSEHSSIERLNPEEMRSRKSTMAKKRSAKSGTSSGSNNGHGGGNATPDEWKLVNLAFQEAASYPILFQLNQQLQTISMQLAELSTANALQLKATYRLLRETMQIKKQKNSWTTFFKYIFFVWIPIIASPFLLKLLYRLYKSRRALFARVLIKYM
uniref:Transmembrane protein n=1 Tax=Panagrellus redivivus TaxID=6233 RepID=A0A7E4W0R0_PANRE